MLFYLWGTVVTVLPARDPRVSEGVDSASSFSDAKIVQQHPSVPALTGVSSDSENRMPVAKEDSRGHRRGTGTIFGLEKSVRPALGTISPIRSSFLCRLGLSSRVY